MNQNKLNLTQALVVEGKYDAARLANLVDATILTTDGFAIFKDKTMQALFKRIAAAQGMILLTDSDAAGFKIRHYITGLVGPQNVLQAYIPAVPGKEPRKPEPGKEGLLGVEGVDDALILQGLHTALAAAPLQAQQQNTDPITYTDLYEWGLSGSANASERRRTFLRILGLPPRLSKKEIIQVLNTLYTRDALQAQLEAMKQRNYCKVEGGNLSDGKHQGKDRILRGPRMVLRKRAVEMAGTGHDYRRALRYHWCGV